ncbi:amidohydrolase family protein [Leifsonia sp. NPDC058194]|uniref:amidohydrolase family protein n=1 Tax=Leifsonia sp. NPDC058194 TaxID=3346374 RepID=UPI0036DEF1D5
MRNVIAIEEHIVVPDDAHVALWRDSVPMIPDAGIAATRPVLEDVGANRLAAMDNTGIDLAILSNVGTVQPLLDRLMAERMAAEANDYLAGVVAGRPDRYQGFATIALQDPEAGAIELERAVKGLGLRGVMLFGPTNGLYLDHPRFEVFWSAVEALDVPVFLHPATPPVFPANLVGREELAGAVWGWTMETGTHFLRLVFGGVFDRHPNARVILGHLGETIPYLAARLDSRARAMGWYSGSGKTPSRFLRDNLLVATSGVFSDPPLRCAISTLGAENIMFALDYPFESQSEATDWFDGAEMSGYERGLIGRSNAERVFALATDPSVRALRH